ncbi:MAG TPA: PAS domain S-box protein [Spirochaetota bacterium]|nr:PAS domain S-box protein [Spirochaetota bacterium]
MNKKNMKSDDFFQSIVRLTSDIIWEIDENWNYTYVTSKLDNYLGYTADEILGKTPFSLMDPAESVKILEILNSISSKRKHITNFELKLLNKKNETIYLMINAIPVIDMNNNFRGYRGITRDITDKKLMEEALIKSENHLSKLMNNLPGMAFIGRFDNEFKMDFVSDGAYDLTGYLPSDYIKNESLTSRIIHPDDAAAVYKTVIDALKEKKQFEILHRIITADKKIKWIMVKGFGIFRDNRPVGIEGFSFDITETKNAIEYGKINERRFKDLFESNPQGIAIGNKDGFIVQANKTWKKMFGYSDDDMYKLHLNDLRMEHNKKSDISLFRSIFNGINEFYREERLFIKKDGSQFWCDLTVALIENPDGNEPYAIGLYADITVRKKIEEQLKRFHEELGSLVSERTEEINRLTLKVINSQEEERQRIARDLHDGIGQTILAAKYAINSFTKGDNKDNALLERGKLLIDIASQELREVYTGIYPSMLNELGLNDTINWFIRNFLETAGLKVNYKNTPKADIPYNLSVNIYRIIQELFNNIVKHADATAVDVSLFQEEQFIIIEISDNGNGFEIENTRKTSTGAGLINVRQRVEYLKGHIEMESIKGRTRIKIRIPLE